MCLFVGYHGNGVLCVACMEEKKCNGNGAQVCIEKSRKTEKMNKAKTGKQTKINFESKS